MGWERWSTFGNVPERPRRGIRQLHQKRKHTLDLVHENYDWQKSGGKKAPPSRPAKGKAKGEGEASRRGKRILDIHCVPPAPHGGRGRSRGRKRKHARLFSRLFLTLLRLQSNRGKVGMLTFLWEGRRLEEKIRVHTRDRMHVR